MRFTDETLPSMADADVFCRAYPAYAADALAHARLFPKFSVVRLKDAHGAWQEDLQRLSEREKKLYDGPDHYKQCGHLTFWLRRFAPMVETVDLRGGLADAEGYPLTNAETQFREFLFGYANEYLAFDLGFQICKFYELSKLGGSGRAEKLELSPDYYRTMCNFMKFKTVSPHALFLIYKSLFL